MKQTINFGKFKEKIDPPDLMAIQRNSYGWFLQKDTPPAERKKQGLQKLFLDTFPIEDFNSRVVLEFVEYSIGEPKLTEKEAKDKETTYGSLFRAKLRLIYKETGEIKEQDVFMREIPIMAERATFIINGAERVVVNQLHRSPGVYYSYDKIEGICSCKMLPYYGAWVELEIDSTNLIYARINKKRRILVTTLLRALGYNSNSEMLSIFSKKKKSLPLTKKLLSMRLAEDILDEKGRLIATAGDRITEEMIEILKKTGVVKASVFPPDQIQALPILNTLEKDEATTPKKALIKIAGILRPGEPPNVDNAKESLHKMFFDQKSYDLGNVGRYKMNQKLGLNIPLTQRALTKEDIIEAIKYLISFANGEKKPDDIDHLGNRRIRSVGELLSNHLRAGFARMERSVKEKMTMQDLDTMTPQSVMNVRPITAGISEFFGSSQLSQFMDQTNPLSELTHKRRLSALGVGGLTKERAGFEVRDIHLSHYGRICPIETPEGPNIGLIASLSIYARPNEFGFLETPYFRVKEAKATNEIVYFTADQEAGYNIAYAGTNTDEDGNFIDETVSVRRGEEFPIVPREKVDFIDVSPKQLLSISTALIPFLEHDDANRALMGSNMQRQAVPLLYPEPPLVITGMEEKIVRDCGIAVVAKSDGLVKKVTADRIEIEETNKKKKIYNLIKYSRSNQGTCINQRPVVREGQKIEKGDIISTGPSIADGKLALGKNLLVAFMPWEGYNFEDAIILSERMLKEDIFTSIYIDKFELEARDTQLGAESVTRDIPNIGEDALKNLDERGIIRMGAIVRTGDILVGKVTPKGEKDLSPEYKLLYSIFGEKVREVRDTSLRMPYGDEGIVIEIKHFSTKKGDNLPTGIEEMVKVFVAKKRKVTVGDKMAGRHGNKGVVSKILAEEDLPHLPDGTPVDIILNTLSIPSRMNVGQLFEASLGWAIKELGEEFAVCPVFDSASEEEIKELLEKAGLPGDGKVDLYDGRTGEPFENKVSCGYLYIMKLAHLVEDKVHARSIGPYSLVTQQPLGGKAQFGGQRFGEMEVWALEAYGASHILQELLTIKSDDIMGRARAYGSIVRGENVTPPGIPESFNVLINEIRGLSLNIDIVDEKGNSIDLKEVSSKKEEQFLPFGRE
ncbi:DNA-directed RNA polymerase subunit beta [bacterium]|nr:DNA-directed RNA polymerase subunit beta [bacterium]MBU1598971.1 DNA-directed RNA polymerase subunit beta [bacterium]